jgi:GTP pyrophosphokinase
MFCDAWRKSKMTTEELVKTIPYNVGSIIQKLSKADDKYDLANQDEDVILIKLAERLHNMRTVEFLDESKRMEKAKETLEIILPVAKKMGDSKILTELNDLAMKYLCK